MISEKASIGNRDKKYQFLDRQVKEVYSLKIIRIESPYSNPCFNYIPGNKYNHGKKDGWEQVLPFMMKF